jgi:hypothetical protein
VSEPRQPSEAELVISEVDTREWGPTEADEEAVLGSLYGAPDADGVYRGGPV